MVLLDAEGVGDGAEERGVGVGWLELLHLAEEGEEGCDALGGALGVGVGRGDLLDAEVEAGGVAEAGDEGGGVGQGEMQAEGGDVASLGEGQANLADAPDGGEEGDVGVEAGENAGSAKGAGGGAGSVEHGVDLLGRGGVRGGDGSGGELGDAEQAAGGDDVRGGPGGEPDRDGEDVVTGVGLACGGDGGEVGGEALGVEAPEEDLGEGDAAVGAGGVGDAVEGEGDLVEIALEEDSRGVDEVLVVGRVGDGFAVEVGGEADGLQVGVDDSVGLGQETGGAGGGFLVQDCGRDDHGEDEQEKRQPGARALGHVKGIPRAACAMP